MRRNTRRCWLGRTTSMIPMERMETKREYRTEVWCSFPVDVWCELSRERFIIERFNYQIIIVSQYVFRLWSLHFSVGSYSLEFLSDSTKSFLVWPHSVLTCGPLSLETGPQCTSVSHVLRFSVVSSWCERAELASLCLCLSLLHKPSSAVFLIFQKGHLRGLKPCLSPAGTMTLKTSWSPTWSQILRLSVWRQRGNDNNDPTIRISEARQLFPIPLLRRWRTKCLITVHPTKNKHLTHNISTYLPFWHICKSAFIKGSRMT